MAYKTFLHNKLKFSDPTNRPVKYIRNKRERKEKTRDILAKIDAIKKENE